MFAVRFPAYPAMFAPRTSKTATTRLSSIARHLTSTSLSGIRTMATRHTILKLNNGEGLPAIGFGTWQDKDSQEGAVREALKAGYRHIDTARIYGTELAVAAGLKASGVPRKDVFITTKLWNNKHHPDDVEAACDASLKDLGTDYLDMYLMHWPASFQRGETPLPKGNDGKVINGNIDYVDVGPAIALLQCRVRH